MSVEAGQVASNVIDAIPGLNLLGISDMIKRKSAEKWFKTDLMNDLKGMGFSPAQVKDIKKYLNTGKDQDLTRKMQELIAANPEIADQLTERICARAQERGVPSSSINQDALVNMPPSMSNYPESLPHYMRSEGLGQGYMQSQGPPPEYLRNQLRV